MTEKQNLMITSPKCHGKGVSDVPAYDGDELKGYNPTLCNLCHGTGKVTVDTYEWLQAEFLSNKELEKHKDIV